MAANESHGAPNAAALAAEFAPTYAEARAKFIAAAEARSLAVERHVHPRARGASGEELSIDVALLGDPNATALLVITSAMHGVEGFGGSGCQVALLGEPMVAAAMHTDVAILFVHAVNPYGFSHLRRANEDNVDLNRNFRDFSVEPPRNEGYAALHALLVPDAWPPAAANTAAIGAHLARHGAAQMQAAVSSGQSEFPDGLFYAGRAPAWSNTILRDILRRHGRSRARLAWIDLHAGLGMWGHGERIHSGPNDAAAIARNRAWYGSDVTTVYDRTSTSAEASGVAYDAALASCPGAQYTGIVVEFGTQPLDRILQALRADQWLANHPGAGNLLADAIRRQMRESFYDDSDTWRGLVYGQARGTVLQALRGLADSR
ncbi:MAG TPA: M14 family metallopeptidase [Casimicrobiaceae bacterium]|nr:M14 family metallopeptidase [Casimicrobiaceae bacterium]